MTVVAVVWRGRVRAAAGGWGCGAAALPLGWPDPRIRDDRDTHTREDLLRIDQGEGKHQRWCRDARPERSRRIKYP